MILTPKLWFQAYEQRTYVLRKMKMCHQQIYTSKNIMEKRCLLNIEYIWKSYCKKNLWILKLTYLNKYYWKFEIYLNLYENNNVEKIFEYKND